MGRELRREHITFFTARMDDHDRVEGWVIIPSQHEYLFRITRLVAGGTASDVIVHLTDAYRYGLAEFFARPDRLRAGSFVVIGMPHAGTSEEVIEKAREHQIGIGHIGKLMGALNYTELWEYKTPDERRREEERRRKEQEA